jgi:hypothetical protein
VPAQETPGLRPSLAAELDRVHPVLMRRLRAWVVPLAAIVVAGYVCLAVSRPSGGFFRVPSESWPRVVIPIAVLGIVPMAVAGLLRGVGRRRIGHVVLTAGTTLVCVYLWWWGYVSTIDCLDPGDSCSIRTRSVVAATATGVGCVVVGALLEVAVAKRVRAKAQEASQ